MTSTTFFIIFIPILAILLLSINLILAPHNPYQEKDSAFECGFHSFLGQNRTQFSISFFIFGLLFLLFDLEIVLLYPLCVSQYNNDSYGSFIGVLFIFVMSLGFIFELGKNALTFYTLETFLDKINKPNNHPYISFKEIFKRSVENLGPYGVEKELLIRGFIRGEVRQNSILWFYI